MSCLQVAIGQQLQAHAIKKGNFVNMTWILVAHRGGARLFENSGPGKGLKLVEDIPHPEGRLKSGEIDADKPGRAFDSFGNRHGMSQEHGAADQVSLIFAKHLCDKLEKARAENRFGRLVLVAEPRLLGELRGALDKPTTALVCATLDKNLAGVENSDIPQHLGELVTL
jgi:protein required for attachment to host cells